MELIFDPTILAGLATLVVLEIVLGIDNLIFIAILSDKLPPHERQRARFVGLSLALGMRLVLLASLSWMIKLTAPLFTVIGHEVSGRDLILIVGGFFLLFKGTMELHEKLEGHKIKSANGRGYARFWHVIIQIVVLDAIFSIDAVITAVGMVEHLWVMMAAVCIAMSIMIMASNRLMNFVSAHPTVVILCLGFLLMIGFSLIVEGLGYHVPKGYLYAAIGFSVLIEAANQLMQRNKIKTYEEIDPRTRVTDAVLALIGGRTQNEDIQTEVSPLAPKEHEQDTFSSQEKLMMQRVLRLSAVSVESIMTPRQDTYWIDLSDPLDVVLRDIRDCPFSCIVVTEGNDIDNPLGILHKKQVADLLIEDEKATVNLREIIKQPLVIPSNVTVLNTMDIFQKNRLHVAFIFDEYGTFEGLITLTDVAEAIAGDMPENHEQNDDFTHQPQTDGSHLINGSMSISDLKEIVPLNSVPDGDFNTVAGMFLALKKRLPKVGETITLEAWELKVEAMEKRRITRIRFSPLPDLEY